MKDPLESNHRERFENEQSEEQDDQETKNRLEKDGAEITGRNTENDDSGGFFSSILSRFPLLGSEEKEERIEEEGELKVLQSVSDSHQGIIAPNSIESNYDHIKLGQDYAKTLWVEEFLNEESDPAMLENIISSSQIPFDFNIHIKPRDSEKAEFDLKQKLGKLEYEKDKKEKNKDVDRRIVKEKLEDYDEMYRTIKKEDVELFDVSTYLTVRGPDKETMERNVRSVEAELRRPPANAVPKKATARHDRGAISTSPIGYDAMNKEVELFGDSVADMFPFHSTSLIEEEGIPYGFLNYNSLPVILDTFGNRGEGYNQIRPGTTGSGKTHGEQLNLMMEKFLRQYNPEKKDLLTIIVDPMRDFVGFNEVFDGEHIIVDGSKGLNPLEIQKTPPEVLEKFDDIEPLKQSIKEGMTFFKTFFEIHEYDINEEEGTLRQALKRSYKNKGITKDPSTHDRESPTISDVMDILADMLSNPGNYTYSGEETEASDIKEHASKLLRMMEPFREGGQYEHLAKPTEIDIQGNDTIYVDLQQGEGSGSGKGLMLQLLMTSLYHRAKKEVDKDVIMVIDEAHYILRHSANLEFLEILFRHSRHINMSIHLLSQTVKDFRRNEKAKDIWKNTGVKIVHKVKDDLQEMKDDIGLNEREVDWIKNDIVTGSDEGDFSQALLMVEGENYPITIKGSKAMNEVASFDPNKQDFNELPQQEPGIDAHDYIKKKLSEDLEEKQGIGNIIEGIDNEHLEKAIALNLIEIDDIVKALYTGDRRELVKKMKRGADKRGEGQSAG